MIKKELVIRNGYNTKLLCKYFPNRQDSKLFDTEIISGLPQFVELNICGFIYNNCGLLDS